MLKRIDYAFLALEAQHEDPEAQAFFSSVAGADLASAEAVVLAEAVVEALQEDPFEAEAVSDEQALASFEAVPDAQHAFFSAVAGFASVCFASCAFAVMVNATKNNIPNITFFMVLNVFMFYIFLNVN